MDSAAGKAVRLVFAGDAVGLREMLTEEVATAADPSFNESTALHVAVGENEEACIDVILEVCPAAVRCQDIEARTPLHHVSTLTSRETVVKLLAAGAEVNGKDRRGRSALRYAVDAMAVDAVDALLEAGADPTGLLGDDDHEDQEDDEAPAANYLIATQLAKRLGEVPPSVSRAEEATLDDHDFQATIFSKPRTTDQGATFQLTLAVCGDPDEEEDEEEEEEEETTLEEAVVEAEVISFNHEKDLVRCFLTETPLALYDRRPDLLLVKGRELLVRSTALLEEEKNSD